MEFSAVCVLGECENLGQIFFPGGGTQSHSNIPHLPTNGRKGCSFVIQPNNPLRPYLQSF